MGGSFALLFFGMAGLPLTSGFIAKFGVFAEAWSAGYEWLVVIAVSASVIALAFYLRIIVMMYMEDEEVAALVVPRPVRWVLWIAVGATLLWGVLPATLLNIAADALPL